MTILKLPETIHSMALKEQIMEVMGGATCCGHCND